MIEIKNLLLKFKNIVFLEEIKKQLIQEAVSKTTNLLIKKEDIKIKNNVIFLKIKPIYKNEILIKKEKIFFELKKTLSKKIPTDIR